MCFSTEDRMRSYDEAELTEFLQDERRDALLVELDEYASQRYQGGYARATAVRIAQAEAEFKRRGLPVPENPYDLDGIRAERDRLREQVLIPVELPQRVEVV